MLAATGQTWPPFLLVAGLLLIGEVAAADGLFEMLGAHLARAPLHSRGLLLALLGLAAVVTAVLNLDTSVVFVTPVLVHAARRRGLDERPFVYGSVFMANSASLLLPGSNLTNLLVVQRDPTSGAAFAARMLPAWLAVCALTAAFLLIAFASTATRQEAPTRSEVPQLRLGIGAAAALIAVSLVLLLQNAALPVLGLGIFAAVVRRLRPQLDVRALVILFALGILLGTAARVWNGPTQLLDASGPWVTAAIAAVGATFVNNLPAAVLFSAHTLPHPRALLVGLDLGPNLAVTGSLSGLLWLQVARATHADASIATYTRLGAVLVPITIAGAMVALCLR